MFQMKWCTKQKMFSMHDASFVEKTGIGTPDNSNYLILTHMHILIIKCSNGSHIF